ncbi:unnamed protein product [Vicia faba]|uniref:DUF4283 domain-containing protein n=1 Tax=Vicia faba TaxID=3906 RepID=A0AAV0Z5N1_VICFA|nr:unnamed protein product [Vicia faba]
MGKQFGFARLIEVDDARMMAVRLNNVHIMGKKIHVNVPRFERTSFIADSREGRVGALSKEKNLWQYVGFRGHESTHTRWGRRTFADVLVNNSQKHISKVKLSFSFVSKEEDRKRLEKAFIRKSTILGSTYNIQTFFEMKGMFGINVIPLGVNLCLLQEKEDIVFDALFKEEDNWWKSWFSVIRKWSEGELDDTRLMWIQVYGIPAHGWHADFFVKLANSLSVFVCIDEITAPGSNLEVARIQLKVPLAFKLVECINVEIDGKCFDLTLKEDFTGLFRVVTSNSFSQITGSGSSNSEDGWSSDYFEEHDASERNEMIDSIEEFSPQVESAGLGSKISGQEGASGKEEL